jgi:hypothetical protein
VTQLPIFEPDEVALLVSSVEKSLERLYEASEKVGGNDAELLEYGKRYAILLEKLQTIANR